MHTASSAKRVWSASVSDSLWTATVATPSSRHARITRRAISPRLAMRTFLNTGRSALLDLAELVAVLDGLAALDDARDDRARELRLDLVHELHRLDDAERRAGRDRL